MMDTGRIYERQMVAVKMIRRCQCCEAGIRMHFIARTNVNVKKSMKYFGFVWRRACLFLVFALQYVIRSKYIKAKKELFKRKQIFRPGKTHYFISRKYQKINLHIYYIFLSILRLKLQSALEVLLRSNLYVD